MKKIFSIGILVFLFFILLPKITIRAFSSDNFSVSYDCTYTVSEKGITHAEIKATLINQASGFYATNYKINLSLNDISNVQASDSLGKITPRITRTTEGNSFEIPFNVKAVGKGKSLKFEFSFDTKDIAEKLGNIWEINIPPIANQEKSAFFNVHVRVPEPFGLPSYEKPVHSGKNLDYSREELGASGISIGFGDSQVYKFNLQYHLKNNGLFSSQETIVLPASTNYQDVEIEKINPKPTNVTVDSDGNWIALYNMNGQESLGVSVTGNARIYISPKEDNLTDEQIILYTKSLPHWEQSSKIKTLSQSLRTPEAIYNYVVKKLTYDFSRVRENSIRFGAQYVIDHPSSAACLEFTDLFIAMARAAGIPAREVDGFAYTQNIKQKPLSLANDVLHAWPEYYDLKQNAWIMVDPTWENTTGGTDYFHTLDFDHVAFVVKGASSDYPIPAGDYKIEGQNTKDVNVEFSNNFKGLNPKITSDINFPSTAYSGLPVTLYVTLKNTQGIMFISEKIKVIGTNISPDTQTVNAPIIPPFGSVKIPIKFSSKSFLTKEDADITIQIGNSQIKEKVSFVPIFLSKTILIEGGVLIAIIAAIIFFIANRIRSLPFSKRKG